MYVSYIFLTSLKIRRSQRLLELFDLIVYFHFILCNLCVLNTSIARINIGKVHFCTTDNFKPVYVCLGSAARLPLKISDCCATNMDDIVQRSRYNIQWFHFLETLWTYFEVETTDKILD